MEARETVEPSTAERLRDTLPWTSENMLVIARAYLEDPQHGDVPESVHHGFVMSLDYDEAQVVLRQIEALRATHFARLGKPVPAYTGEFPR